MLTWMKESKSKHMNVNMGALMAIHCPKKDNEDGQEPEEQALWGVAEATGIVYSVKEEIEGRPYWSLQLPE